MFRACARRSCTPTTRSRASTGGSRRGSRACPSSSTRCTVCTRNRTIRSPARAAVYGIERVAGLFSHAELRAEPRRRRDARRHRRAGTQADVARERHRPHALRSRPRSRPTTCSRRARELGACGPDDVVSAWSDGWFARRGTSRCSRPPRQLREHVPHLRFAVIGDDDHEKDDALDAADRARAAAAGVRFLGGRDDMSTGSTRRWTSTCSRRTARAFPVRRWRRPRWACPWSRPTSGGAARWSTTARTGFLVPARDAPRWPPRSGSSRTTPSCAADSEPRGATRHCASSTIAAASRSRSRRTAGCSPRAHPVPALRNRDRFGSRPSPTWTRSPPCTPSASPRASSSRSVRVPAPPLPADRALARSFLLVADDGRARWAPPRRRLHRRGGEHARAVPGVPGRVTVSSPRPPQLRASCARPRAVWETLRYGTAGRRRRRNGRGEVLATGGRRRSRRAAASGPGSCSRRSRSSSDGVQHPRGSSPRSATLRP